MPMRGSTPIAGAGGRDAAFERYVASRQHALLRTAVLLTGGDVATAEDLLQTALSRLYLAWHRVEREAALDSYVRRIMINQYTSWWRRAWRHRESTVDPVDLPQQRGVSRPALDDEVAERAAVWALVQLLPPRQRATIVLRYYEDLSEVETAEVLGCTVGTVKAASSRAVARLRVLHSEEVSS